MSFKLGDIIVKDILYAMALDGNTDVPKYVLTQLSEASIAITAESTDVTDKNGNVVKKIFKNKSGEFSATNAFLNANIIANAGADVVAAEDGSVIVPMIEQVKASETTFTLGTTVQDDLSTVKVNEIYGDGTLGKAYTLATEGTATAEKFVVSSDGVITLPTDSSAKLFVIRYDKTFTADAVKISNRSDKFPSSVKMLLKVAYYNPCDKSEVKSAYIEIPSFQVSPETTVSLNADSPTMDFNGTLELDYCEGDNVLYNMYLFDEED